MLRAALPGAGRPGHAVLTLTALLGLVLVSARPSAQTATPAETRPRPDAARSLVAYAEVRPVLDALRADLLPGALAPLDGEARAAAWLSWAADHDATIRARLDRGDDDSALTLLLFGTSFTREPRASFAAATTPPAVDTFVQGPLVQRRIADLVRAVRQPGDNERVRFVAQLLARRGVPLDSPDAVPQYFRDGLTRLLTEYTAFFSADTLPSTRFRARGLSSDTSIQAAFAIDQALESLARTGVISPAAVRRAAIIGPGLDFTDKQEGLDVYPVQTIQPFALLDSMARLGLGASDVVPLTTYDINPRVNAHLASARERAGAEAAYVVHLPRDDGQSWSPGLAAFWERLGSRVGVNTAAPAPPELGGRVRLRAVRVPPAVVRAIDPQDLDIVLERPAGPSARTGADLVVATNVLVYYDVFEQSLALAGIAALLAPGGVLLTNTPLFLLPGIPMTLGGEVEVPLGGGASDWVQWYRRD